MMEACSPNWPWSFFSQGAWFIWGQIETNVSLPNGYCINCVITYCYIVSALYHCIVTLYYFVIRLFVVMWWYYVTVAPSSQMYTYFCILLCFIRLMWLFWRIAMGLLFLWAWLNILVISRQLINWLIDCIWFYNLCWMKVGFGLKSVSIGVNKTKWLAVNAGECPQSSRAVKWGGGILNLTQDFLMQPPTPSCTTVYSGVCHSQVYFWWWEVPPGS